MNTKIEKSKNASINVKFLMVAHANLYLYDNKNMITEMHVVELNENISIYDLIAFLGKTTKKNNKLHLITPEHNLELNLKKDDFKSKIEHKLGKDQLKSLFSTA